MPITKFKSEWFFSPIFSLFMKLGADEDSIFADLKNGDTKTIFDLSISSGIITAHVVTGAVTPPKIALKVTELDDNIWESLYEQMSDQAIYYSSLVTYGFTHKLDGLLQQEKLSLIPKVKECEVLFSKRELLPKVMAHLCGAILRTIQKRPLSFLTLRGSGPEQMKAELLRRRKVKHLQMLQTSSTKPQGTSHEREEKVSNIAKFFGKMSIPDFPNLTLKADELPASLLKRLGGHPFGNCEDEAERKLEEFYVSVATKAQGMGMDLARLDESVNTEE